MDALTLPGDICDITVLWADGLGGQGKAQALPPALLITIPSLIHSGRP